MFLNLKHILMKKTTGLLFSLFFSSLLIGCASQNTMTSDASKRKAVTVVQTPRGAMISSDERVLFDSGKSNVKQEGQVFIDRVATILKEKTKANVTVEGHTDNTGAADLNMRLSEARAQSVKSALVKAGVDSKRITAKGFGFSNPVADNASPEGRMANRRTEILVLGEKIENLGGDSIGDRLSEGFANFMKDPAAALKNAFGS